MKLDSPTRVARSADDHGIEVEVIPIVTTAHLTAEEADAPADGWPAYTLTGVYGAVSYCCCPEEWSDEDRERFPNLANVGRWAKSHGFHYVRFDRDGPTIDGLEVFEW